MAFKRLHKSSLADISARWDLVSEKRAEQLASGVDSSFKNLLLPSILQLSRNIPKRNVLEVGCGPGFLTCHLAKTSQHVTAIDLSPKFINYATTLFPKKGSNVKFVCGSIEQFIADNPERKYDLAVANMVLMTTPFLRPLINSVRRGLPMGGHFIFTLAHPYFWPRYWAFDEKPWFDYGKEIIIEGPFKITNRPRPIGSIVYVHRPLEMYIQILVEQSFQIVRFLELKSKISGKARASDHYPRFIACICKAV